jgi:hypothetical protein
MMHTNIIFSHRVIRGIRVNKVNKVIRGEKCMTHTNIIFSQIIRLAHSLVCL